MAGSISGIGSGQPVQQTQKAAPPKPDPKAAAPQAKSDVVTISNRGKQAAQQTAQYSPSEEAKESSAQKAVESQAGRK